MRLEKGVKATYFMWNVDSESLLILFIPTDERDGTLDPRVRRNVAFNRATRTELCLYKL